MKKDNALLEVFFNEPTRQWHFEELLKTARISRPQAAQWLRSFVGKGLLQRVRPRGKMPYYIANYSHPHYQVHKKVYALQQLENQGLLSHLASLPRANTAVVFGSLARWDWYKESDIDVFIYGDPSGFNKVAFEAKLHREIQVFVCRDRRELRKLSRALLRNIVEGYLVKGSFDFLEVQHA